MTDLKTLFIEAFAWTVIKILGSDFNSAFNSVWSDDDWLKKFSGKTAEEADGEAAGGETTNTATQEVRLLLF